MKILDTWYREATAPSGKKVTIELRVHERSGPGGIKAKIAEIFDRANLSAPVDNFEIERGSTMRSVRRTAVKCLEDQNFKFTNDTRWKESSMETSGKKGGNGGGQKKRTRKPKSDPALEEHLLQFVDSVTKGHIAEFQITYKTTSGFTGTLSMGDQD